ncbi:MAG: hypothetical protein NTV70_22540 [Acidobacteria bacterium]|nr:hypothetical protein [Acidobacteriota bacterium]
MPVYPAVDRSRVDEAVERAVLALAPDVVQIRYQVSEDWSGDPALFFKVVLTDEASRRGRREATLRARAVVDQEVDPEQFGYRAYYNFRTLSEHLEVKDPAWA